MIPVTETKICKDEIGNGCNVEKPLVDFQFRKDTGKLRNICKICRNKCNKAYFSKYKQKLNDNKNKYYKNNRNDILEQKRQYYNEHKKEISRQKKEYYKNNKSQIIEQKRQYSNNRRKKDIGFKLKCNLRNRVSSIFKNNSNKICSAVKDLGLSVTDLKQYLEMKFYIDISTGGKMTWENYGTGWEIDHIIPLSTLNLTDENQFCRAAHYTNLQPLWKKDNQEKKNSLTWDWE